MNEISERLSGLNPRQREAVTAPDGPLLVTAGAGSGKTAVLVNRIAWLIGVKNVPANRIIAVTFTNKAAREMKGRVQDLLMGERVNPVVGTFHGLCNQFLRVRHQEAGLDRNFSIMDQDDQKAFISALMKARNYNLSDVSPKEVQSYINNCKESKCRAGESDIYSHRYTLLEDVYRIYEQECEEQGRVDFAELILRTVEVMERNAEVRERIQDNFLHVLIDEFQDTNELQYQWMGLFGGKHRNITVVGDEDQSIYSWRGALAGNLKRFEQDYGDAYVIRLEQNYRSTKPILDAANALIKRNTNRYEKKLWTGRSGGSAISFWNAGDSNEEAQFVVSQIKNLQSSGRDYSEFAVLYRTNAQSRNFEEILGAEGVPFRVYGGVRFYHRKEVKDALSYLRLAVNPGANDALLRIINSPPRGIGDAAKRAIAERAKEMDVSYWEATCDLAKHVRRWARFEPFVKVISKIQKIYDRHSLSKLMAETVKLSGLRQYYENHNDITERERVANLDELISAATAYEQTRIDEPSASLVEEYLDSVALDPGDVHDDAPEEKVQMMTLHSAKGLEFPVVFLTGLDESILPHFFSMYGNNPFSTSTKKQEDSLQEERRLCYVGMTRAQEQLYLTRAHRRMVRGSWENFKRSRFLNEIPKRLIEHFQYGSTPELFDDDIDDSDGWLGKSVEHKKFGSGIVTDVELDGTGYCLTIEFEQFGAKTIMSEYVKPAP